MKYYSTNLKSPDVCFSQALLKGLAPDGGLYMPYSIPTFSKDTISAFPNMDYVDIAFTVLNMFLNGEIEESYLKALCKDAYNFDVPIERVTDSSNILRLDRGPTASFKDFAARMMARLMNYFIGEKGEHYTILTATSGDTGSAVANAFHGLDGIDVIILFPRNEVTDMQRKQMTTLGGNVRTIALDGKFDDCQRLVKQAFTDPDFVSRHLSSANSINIGRLLPQSVYYCYAWSRVAANIDDKVIFSVPSGNFGDLMGGIIAGKMGLPIEKMIVAVNENNEVPEYLRTGVYTPIVPSKNCISSAMNVGHPSNFARMLALYNGIMDEKGNISQSPDMDALRNDYYALSVTDRETEETIVSVWEKYNTLIEPHGAVAWNGLESFISKNSDFANKKFISLETAHPFKFKTEIEKLLGFTPEIPYALKGIENKPENFTELPNDYNAVKRFIQE